MKLLSVIFSLFCLISLSKSQSTEEEEYGDCRPIYTHNYGYKIYFHIPKDAVLPDKSIYFNFSVKAPSDAHVLLSTVPNPKDSDPLYEIVIGAGWNTFSDIRRLHSKIFRVNNITRGIVNKNIAKKFWIKIVDGLISVGEGGSSSTILKHKDNDPLDIKYLSFSSWHSSNAKWYFDCGDPSPLPAIVLNKTASERLRNKLFSNYDPYVTPVTDDDFVIINSNLTINYIFLDPISSSMDVRGMLRVNWVDFKLQWSPSDNEDIEIIRLTERKIWQPNFLLYNGATLHQKWFDDGIVTVNYLGEVTWITPVHFVTRCNIKMSEWPADQHTCQIQIGLVDNQKNVHLAGLNDIILENENGAGIWEVISVVGDGMYVPSPWDDALPDQNNSNETEISSVLTVEILMKRYSSIYYYLFYIPLKVTMVMSVISFCLPYTCPQRVVLQVMVLTMYVMNLLSIDSVLPPVINVTPKILSLSTGLLMVAIICTVLTLWLIQLSHSGKRISVPLILDKLVDIFTLRLDFFSNNKRGQKLMNLEDEDEEAENTSKLAKQENKLSEKQRFQAFLLILDYLLLISIIISYTILIILF